jgi:protein arginine kinase
MSLEKFISEAISPWMKNEGFESEIVLSSRIRLARNLKDYSFPFISTMDEASLVVEQVRDYFSEEKHDQYGPFELLEMDDMRPNEKRVLVEKHLISPQLADESKKGAVLLSSDESVSIMVNEEDHLRIQCLFPGFQISEGLVLANGIDDWIEQHLHYAFDEKRGYLTSCLTNIGTGLRASVMMHLPALVLTKQLNKILPAINQLGLVVRGIYGEGSEALGNLFQISNQITLGKSEEDIVEDLRGVVLQLINQERAAREMLLQSSKLHLEDRVFRSYGILAYARSIESNEASQRLSDVRLGIDLKILKGISASILNELMILTQPGFFTTICRGDIVT